ncbi:hypothetical protein HH219_15720 [Pseudoalteromonas sp. NEC-BIFX-2020_015]|uniref:hypothetical protein n=1 Tax=Pseudoalteromonas sp. NEC-BIFX-2020_015 TaxID=2729544 RepID=UPI0014616D96|nr:hypothetical protein [Pseudoalteromonas sp. NEC-BIFX-2020_015]NMR26958.1 hypothetical protein [Pseudoalteromonas sp. NEC-BIFX-2020_015]
MQSFFNEGNMISAISAFIALSSAVIALAGLTFTYKKNKFDKRLSLDKELFDAAVIKLEASFEILTKNKDEGGMVINHRSNWIMSAREIEKFKQFKNKIETEHYQMVLNSIEEYWSHKFYDVVGKSDLIQQGYYTGLHAGSVLIVYAFASWKEDQECPIDNVNYENLLQGSKVFQGRYGLIEYIKQDRQFSHLAKS